MIKKQDIQELEKWNSSNGFKANKQLQEILRELNPSTHVICKFWLD